MGKRERVKTMNSKELRKMSKGELVDRILELDVVIEKLQVRVEELQVELDNREVRIEEAGNLAEAALQVNGVVEAAQKAADQYLTNVKSLNEKTTAKCHQLEADTKKRCDDMELATKQKCESMERETESKINARWSEFTQKVDRYLEARGDLTEILKFTIDKNEE